VRPLSDTVSPPRGVFAQGWDFPALRDADVRAVAVDPRPPPRTPWEGARESRDVPMAPRAALSHADGWCILFDTPDALAAFARAAGIRPRADPDHPLAEWSAWMLPRDGWGGGGAARVYDPFGHERFPPTGFAWTRRGLFPADLLRGRGRPIPGTGGKGSWICHLRAPGNNLAALRARRGPRTGCGEPAAPPVRPRAVPPSAWDDILRADARDRSWKRHRARRWRRPAVSWRALNAPPWDTPGDR